jgi:hypothetical protein
MNFCPYLLLLLSDVGEIQYKGCGYKDVKPREFDENWRREGHTSFLVGISDITFMRVP